jgi:GTP-binding protein Era
MSTTCGYIALLGRPNAGKSTLLNALVGDKLAAISRKPQTTRNRILGVALHEEAQLLFLDTPGLHHDRGRDLINAMMNRVALHAAAEADLLVYLVDTAIGFGEVDAKFLARMLGASKAPLLVLASKADAPLKHERAASLAALSLSLERFFAEPEHAAWAPRYLQAEPLPLSSKRPEDIAAIKEYMASLLPASPWLFPDDDLTDRPRLFICAELIREQIFRQLGQEIPYGTAVKVEGIEFKPGMVVVRATAVVSRKSHKPILLGKGGARIKAIGTSARVSLEKHFDQKVFLDLKVAIAEGWTDDSRLIAELAHMTAPELPPDLELAEGGKFGEGEDVPEGEEIVDKERPDEGAELLS